MDQQFARSHCIKSLFSIQSTEPTAPPVRSSLTVRPALGHAKKEEWTGPRVPLAARPRLSENSSRGRWVPCPSRRRGVPCPSRRHGVPCPSRRRGHAVWHRFPTGEVPSTAGICMHVLQPGRLQEPAARPPQANAIPILSGDAAGTSPPQDSDPKGVEDTGPCRLFPRPATRCRRKKGGTSGADSQRLDGLEFPDTLRSSASVSPFPPLCSDH